jgi:hypothetical protein
MGTSLFEMASGEGWRIDPNKEAIMEIGLWIGENVK